MSMHRANKSRRPKRGFTFDSLTGERKPIPWKENMPWFSHNVKRNRRRNEIAKLSRRINR